ncbi:hypothetical protein R3O04_019250 [Bacteroides hominis]|uniref:hypothetical protein n=1 Tax=Bacteroides hominis TaxID=2763023 RepID=UPI003D6C7597
MPFTLQAERSADLPAVRQANRPIDQPAGFPDGQSAGQPEDTDRPTNRLTGRRKTFWKCLRIKPLPTTCCHKLPPKAGTVRRLEKCPLLCRQKGRLTNQQLTSQPSDRPPCRSPDDQSAGQPENRQTGKQA